MAVARLVTPGDWYSCLWHPMTAVPLRIVPFHYICWLARLFITSDDCRASVRRPMYAASLCDIR
eukprot:357907-Chlamydomonas_euryale.AAC.4